MKNKPLQPIKEERYLGKGKYEKDGYEYEKQERENAELNNNLPTKESPEEVVFISKIIEEVRKDERTKVINEIRLEIASYSKLGVEQTKYLLNKIK